MLRCIVHNPWFALTEVGLILASGLGWILIPEVGIGFILLALLPWCFRLLAGTFPFQRTPFDWLIAIFLVTAWIGYWAAYDKTAAWNKVWIIVLAVLLYYALSAQPKHNLVWISFILFGIGVGTSFYYFLTHDFVAVPRKLEFVNNIGNWIMGIRPQTGWGPIHPNYVAGIVAVTVPFIFYPVLAFKRKHQFPILFIILVLTGLSMAGFALIMTTSRGVILAILSGMGAGILWWFLNHNRIWRWQKNKATFPLVLIAYLCAVVFFLYVGPSQSTGAVTGTSYYGNGSRAELFLRSLYLVHDYSITGGGLGSFPGLFSQYILNIPFYYLPNSHNLFLDVAIEQGMIGGASFLFLYLASLWSVSGFFAMGRGEPVFQWIVLFSIIVAVIHGMVDNYLYNGIGAILSLFLIGLSVNQTRRGGASNGWVLNPGMAGVLAILLLIALIANRNPIRSMWYANLGAVQLAKLELDGFPNSGWAGSEIVPQLGVAEASLRSALQYDPGNQTANYRLGLISMLRQDFESAVLNLETAYKEAPNHRGVIKTLGYCYVWLGETDKAKAFLEKIPEAQEELTVYVWWWATQGRSDLSAKASLLTRK